MSKRLSNVSSNIIPADTLPLGFGCGGLIAGRRRRESLKLLEAAIDCGITYFDTARLYGLGEAEGILGELARHRDRLIITSKAGILPASRRIHMKLWNRGTKILRSAFPNSAHYVPAPASANLRFHAFSPAQVLRSVETSLKQLRTDYLDILLLHECSFSDIENPEVLELLEGLKQKGKIRAFGVATGIEETLSIISSAPRLTDIIQIPSSVLDANVKRIPASTAKLRIIHSCLKGHVQVVLRAMFSDAAAASRFCAKTGVDSRDTVAVAQLILAHALSQVPDGIVLFSSSRLRNVESNVRVAKESIFDAHQIETFALLMAEWSSVPYT
jgi:D-threo-aldose 1-dehydrogenase